MPITIDIEKDTLYLQGIEKGIEQGRQEERIKEKKLFVENLLRNTDFDDQKIANLADVNLAFVRKVKKEINI